MCIRDSCCAGTGSRGLDEATIGQIVGRVYGALPNDLAALLRAGSTGCRSPATAAQEGHYSGGGQGAPDLIGPCGLPLSGHDRAVLGRQERFADRQEAGRALAGRLQLLGLTDPVVLALPRGGVPVAAEVAAALDVRLLSLIHISSPRDS